MKNQESTQDRITRVTEELTARVSASNTSSGKWRGSYTLFKRPNARQRRENKNGLGSPIGPAVKSLTYETEEEALVAVEETIVKNEKLKQQVVVMYDRNYPEHDVTVKLFLLRYWDQIVAQSSCSENVLKKLFFDHETFVEILCNFRIKGQTSNDFHCLVQDLMRDGSNDDEIIRMMRYMKYIFRVAKDAGVYTRNPVTEVLREYTEDQMLMKDLRKALVLRSLSREENIRLLGILRKHRENEPGMVIGFMIRWLTAMLSREVAPLIWKDLVVVESVNIMQILVYKEFGSKDTVVREMTYDDLYRVVPACFFGKHWKSTGINFAKILVIFPMRNLNYFLWWLLLPSLPNTSPLRH